MPVVEQALPFEVFVSSEDQFRPKFEEACEWLDSLGYPHSVTRFGQHKRMFEKFRQSDPLQQTAAQYRSSIYTFLAAYSDCSELVRIKAALSAVDAAGYLGRLKKVTGGRAFIEASRPERSRDFAFELAMASRFLHGGYEVDLTTLADVIAIVDGRKVFVECKRVWSPSKVEASIRDARSQLSCRIAGQSSKKISGLIALNISTLLASSGAEIIGSTEYDIQRRHSDLMTQFFTSNQQRFDSLQTKHIAGYMLEASLGGIAANPQQFSLVNVRGMKIYIGKSTSTNETLVRNLSNRIHNQVV